MEQTLTERTPQRRVSWSRVTGLVTAGAAVAYVGFVDPATRGIYPPCPSRLLLGVDCPGCGGLRGTHDLLHGDVAGALDHNLLLIPFLAMLVYGSDARTAAAVRWVPSRSELRSVLRTGAPQRA